MAGVYPHLLCRSTFTSIIVDCSRKKALLDRLSQFESAFLFEKNTLLKLSKAVLQRTRREKRGKCLKPLNDTLLSDALVYIDESNFLFQQLLPIPFLTLPPCATLN